MEHLFTEFLQAAEFSSLWKHGSLEVQSQNILCLQSKREEIPLFFKYHPHYEDRETPPAPLTGTALVPLTGGLSQSMMEHFELFFKK